MNSDKNTLPDFSEALVSSPKAQVDFDPVKGLIRVDIKNNDRTLGDIEDTARKVCMLQDSKGYRKIFYDHSNFKWQFDYLSEYKLGKDFSRLLPYRPGTFIAFYLGEYFDEKYWSLLEKLINDNSECIIKYFGDKERALSWLLSQEVR